MTQYSRYPTLGIATYPNAAALPALAVDGTVVVTLDTDTIYIFNATSLTWVAVGGSSTVLTVGTIDSQTKSANGAVITINSLVLQTADTTHPGLMSTGVQSIAGTKTFTGAISALNLSGTNTGDQTITLTGDVTGSGTGSFAATIANNAVTNAKLAQMATLTIKGNNTGLTANALDLTVAQVNLILPVFTSTLNGLVPLSGGGTTNFLRADGTWAVAGSGTVTSVSVVSTNGFAGTVASPTSAPAITISTTITGITKGNGTALSAATAGTDYSAGTSGLTTGILKSTTTTGALTIAVAGDFPTLNQNTSGSAASLSATLVETSGGTGQSTYTTGDILYASAANTLSKLPKGTSGYVLTQGASIPSWAPVAASSTAPTVQKFLSGSGTYTRPTSPTPLYIKVKMAGGGGGGSCAGTGPSSTDGGNGGDTSFGIALLVAGGGVGAAFGAANTAGGTASLGSGPLGIALPGGVGGGATEVNQSTGSSFGNGGTGGMTPYFGGGAPGAGSATQGSAGATNTGGGGAGGSTDAGIARASGAGGGSGGFVDAIITSPASTYAYVVGVGGAASTGPATGGTVGGAGGSGIIIVEEYYQ